MTSPSALVELLHFLPLHGYKFTAVTPSTHAAVLAKALAERPTLRDIFGWNRPFAEEDIEPLLLDLLRRGEAVDEAGGKFRSRVRVASIDGLLVLHSAFPTEDADAVFFGPDTYRFWRFLKKEGAGMPDVKHVVDMGTGSGAGGILAARLFENAAITLVDVNERALTLVGANAAAAGIEVELLCSGEMPDGADLVIANPPYMMDGANRTYRDGGLLHGGAVSLDWARQALDRMRPGGTLLMYTGAAFVRGESPLVSALEAHCAEEGALLTVDEIDPDVFGEELDQPTYADVERIAAVSLIARRRLYA